MMATLFPLLCLLTTLSPRPGVGLEILSMSLEGGSKEYLEVRAKTDYVLRCDYRSGYDDPVKEVRWLLYGYPVYVWRENQHPTASESLLGLVSTNPTKEPHNIHFKKVEYSLAGNYTCRVSSANATAQATFSLHVIDASSSPYQTRVQVLSSISNSSGRGNKNTYEVATTESSHLVEFENPECTLVWSFFTPAIFPKPNVTCGYYSFDYDDVIQRLPAGLTMHQFANGSWRASFQSTHIEVASIPRTHRLGCSVRIPQTSYKKMIKADDDFLVDALIDSAGCPSLELEHHPGLSAHIQDATYTCHNDVIPAERDGTAIAKLSCPNGHASVFPDSSVEHGWELELSCSENDVGWRTLNRKDKAEGKIVDIQHLPYCEPRKYSSGVLCVASSSAVLVLLSVVGVVSL